MPALMQKVGNGGRMSISKFKVEFAKILGKDNLSEDQIILLLMRIGVRGGFVTWDAFRYFHIYLCI